MIEIDNASGRRWARGGLIFTLFLSVVANVAHAVLATSEISLWLRVPGAAIWPVLSFVAIEVIVRMVWESTLAHRLARAFILGPAVPAIIVSYEHQSRLLTMMGDSGIVSMIGPIAIDGLMIGCTLALLFTRPVLTIGQIEEAETIRVPEAIVGAPEVESAPVRRPSAPNAATVAAEALQAGADTAEAAAVSGMSPPAVRRYAAVVRELKDNPNLPIDARKRSVRPDVVDAIRSWARTESTR